jgi:hypothetical protein
MFLPRSFIWKRLGQEWLVSRSASTLFAICSLLTLVVTFILYIGIPSASALSTPSIVLIGVAGFAGPFAMFFLWGGMLRFWMQGEPSSRGVRKFWFLLLILGFCYGAVLYYVFVYLSSSRRGGTAPEVSK